jgi:hypothetical protein
MARELHDGLEIFIIYKVNSGNVFGEALAVNIGTPSENEQFSDAWAIEWRRMAGIKEDEMTQGNCERWFDVMESVAALQLPISKREFPKTLWGLSLEQFNAPSTE